MRYALARLGRGCRFAKKVSWTSLIMARIAGGGRLLISTSRWLEQDVSARLQPRRQYVSSRSACC
jgi:hypothetical protein